MSSRKSARRGGRGEAQPSSSRNPSLFFDQDAKDKYTANERIPLVTGRSITTEFLIANGFESILEDLRFQGWIPYLSVNNGVHTTYLRQMYANLREEDDDSHNLVSKINGVNYTITQDSLVEFLLMMNTGEEGDFEVGGACPNFNLNWHEIFPNFNQVYGRQHLCEPNTPIENRNSVASLTLENRLLHHIVTHCLVQRKGSLGNITDYDVGVMACIRNRIKLNLPYMILRNMKTASSRPAKQVYPYAMFFSSYFISFFNISFDQGDLVTIPSKDSAYGADTLARLFVLRNGVWTRRFNRISEPARQPPPVRAYL